MLSVYRNQLLVTIRFDSWNSINLNDKKKIALQVLGQLNAEVLQPKIKNLE